MSDLLPPDALSPDLLPEVAEQRLVDHHCHGVLLRDADEATLGLMLTEGDALPADAAFDSQAGFAFRALCPPVLDLPAHTDLATYVKRRAELGLAETGRRFLRAAGIGTMCVDTGYIPEPITSPAELGKLAGASAHEIVRLERVAEEVAASGVSAAGYAAEVRAALATRTQHAVGTKSIAAYRTGLDLHPSRPTGAQVAVTAGRMLAAPGPPRIADETLQRFLIWCGVDLGLPVQFHVGYGDSDVDLHRCSPLLLTPLLRAIQPTGVPVMLLHNYPYHREAGLPGAGVPARVPRPRAGHARGRVTRARIARRSAGAGPVFQAAVLFRRIRLARAVLPGCGPVPQVPVRLPDRRNKSKNIPRTIRAPPSHPNVRRQCPPYLPPRRTHVNPRVSGQGHGPFWWFRTTTIRSAWTPRPMTLGGTCPVSELLVLSSR